MWIPIPEHQNWEKCPHKSSLVGVRQGQTVGNAGTLLKGQCTRFHVQPLTLGSGRGRAELCEENAGLGALELELRRQTAQFPSHCGGHLSHSNICYTGDLFWGEDSWSTLLENILSHGAQLLRSTKRLRIKISPPAEAIAPHWLKKKLTQNPLDTTVDYCLKWIQDKIIYQSVGRGSIWSLWFFAWPN